MNGALIVDKPPGLTSHDVVARVRRALGTSRMGHTGTLDPLATGVLVLLVGRATRLARFLTAAEKEYQAAIRLGQATATYDAEERMVRRPDGTIALGDHGLAPVDVPGDRLSRVLAEFTGTFRQTPPPFSAKKVGGTAAYRLARRQQRVDVPAAEVTVRELEVLANANGLLTLRVVTSSGFYVRSLAHDIGVRLGCGAHLEQLRRTRAGVFELARSVTLDTVQAEGPAAAARLVPMAALLPGLPEVAVNERGARHAAHGHPLGPEDLADPSGRPAAGPVRVVDREGALLAVGQPGRGGLLQPVVVLV